MRDTTSDKIYLVDAGFCNTIGNNEVWKPLRQFGIQVSSCGNIKTLLGAILKPHKCGKGYLRLGQTVNGVKVCEYVHRLVLLAFVGPPPESHEVNHKNSIRDDNRLENLEYVTSSQNTMQAIRQGRWAVGEKRWNAILNEDMVRTIRQRYAAGEGETVKQISERMQLKYVTVFHVVKRHNWKHVL